MRTPIKLAAFGGTVALVFAGAVGIGAATGSPLGDTATAGHDGAHQPGHGEAGHEEAGHGEAGHGEGAAGAGDMPGGLLVSERGYTLELESPVLPAGEDQDLSFRVLSGGEALQDFEVDHDERMHLILVRRDMSGFQHVHPEMADDGTWTVPVALSPGSWRVFADFVPAAGPAPEEPLTLGADLAVGGQHTPQPLPAPAETAQVDGYEVQLTGDLVAGQESELTLSVSRDGQPVTDLQPYLGAYGHLVALRAGDLAYLHVHPDGGPGDGRTQPGPDVTFYATAPSAGDYRLFLDFRHQGQVRTAELTVTAPPRDDGAASATDASEPGPSVEPPPAPDSTVPEPAQHDSDGHGD